MARRTKREIMDGVDCIKSKLIDHNTVQYERENGEVVVRLHLTDIVTYAPSEYGTITLNTGGWNTVTTRDRINKELGKNCPGWRMWSEKNQPYLGWGRWDNPDRKVYHFHDGIVIDGRTCDGEVYDKERIKRANAWQRKVKQFAKTYVAKLQRREIPAPSAGDCWMCSFVDKKDRAWGESGHGDHVYSHIIEKYYVPSLVVRATKQFGVSQCAQWCLAAAWDEGNPKADEFLESSTQERGFGGIGWEQIEKALYKYCLRWAPYDEATIERIKEEVAA